MKKKEKGLLAAVIVLIASAALWFFAGQMADTDTSETDTEEDTSIVLTESDSSTITEMSWTVSDTSLCFVKDEDTWYLDADREFPVDQDALASMAQTLAAVTASRQLEDPAELSEYGLDAPVLQVSYTDDAGQTTLTIGDSNSVAGGSYCQKSGDEAVYIVDSSLADAFTDDLYTLADMEDFPTIATADITGVTIVNGETTLSLSASEKMDSGWAVSSETESAQNALSSAATTLLNTVAGCSFQSDVNYQCEDMSVYGLDAPIGTLTVDYTETVAVETEPSESDEATETEETEVETETVARQMVLLIGSQDDEGNYYVCLSGSKEVHTMSGTTVENLLQKQLVDLLDTSLISGLLDDYTGMDIQFGDAILQLEKKVKAVEDTEAASDETETEETETEETETESETEAEIETAWYAGDTEIALVDLAGAYGTLSGMTAEQILDEAVQPEGEADMSITLYGEDGTTTVVSFTAYDTNFHLAEIDGVARKLVNRRDVEKLISAFEALMD